MKYFGYEEFRSVIFPIMEGEDVPSDDPREAIMSDIQQLLASSYSLGINPLRGLRGILPQYKWQYHETEIRNAGKIVGVSDFIWLVLGFVPFPNEKMQLVTATKIDRDIPLNLFFAGDEDQSEKAKEMIRFIELLGGDATFW